MALAQGTRLGVCEITSPIAEGGMGAVYRAIDTSLSRQVAIKVLPDALAADPDRLMRFEREAQTLAALNHPQIAAIYAVEKSAGRANDRAWFAEASLVFVLTAVMFAWAKAGDLSSPWTRPVLLLGSLALAAIGARTF